MRIELDSVIAHPRETVFAAYRDDMTAFVDFIPNVRAIEVVKRSDEGHRVELHNVWHGSTELPAALAERLERRFFSWDDHATWDASSYTCEWAIEPHAFGEQVRCHGRLEFIALDPHRTRLEVGGELEIGLKVRAVPLFVTGSLRRTAESFFVRQITANLDSVSKAVAAYLSEDTLV